MPRAPRLASSLALALVALESRPAAAQFQWASPKPLPSSGGFVQSGDPNRDGVGDIVLLRGPYGEIEALRGDGRGGFVSTTTVPVPGMQSGFVVADFDGDGNDDVETSSSSRGSLTFLRSDGRGGFADAAFSPFRAGSTSLVAGDFDGDGFLDVAGAPLSADPGVAIVFGDGAGGFPRSAVVAPAIRPLAIASGDFNGDRRPDFAFADGSRIGVLVAGAGGAFTIAGSSPMSLPGPTLTVGVDDADGDGRPEIFVATYDHRAAYVGVFGGSPAAGFAEIDRLSITGGTPLALDFGDGDGDGLRDVAFGSSGTKTAFLADGTGRYVSTWSTRSTTPGTAGAVLLDVDRDGALDLVSSGEVFPNGNHELRRGSVNAGFGAITDVLFVDGSPGVNCSRPFDAGRFAPFVITVAAPPSRPLGPARFALWLWRDAVPTSHTPPADDFQSVGRSILPTPLTGGSPQPTLVWNNVRDARLGVADRPSSRAPTTVVSRPSGLRRPATFFLQGLIQDRGAMNGKAAMTNAIQVFVR